MSSSARIVSSCDSCSASRASNAWFAGRSASSRSSALVMRPRHTSECRPATTGTLLTARGLSLSRSAVPGPQTTSSGRCRPPPGDPDFDYRSRASSEFTVSNGPYEPGVWTARRKPTHGWWNRSLSGVGRCHRPVRRSRFGIDQRARSPRGKVSFFVRWIVTIAFEVFARCEPGTSAACAAHELRCPVDVCGRRIVGS